MGAPFGLGFTGRTCEIGIAMTVIAILEHILANPKVRPWGVIPQHVLADSQVGPVKVFGGLAGPDSV
jgi:hypothetical protein